MFGADIKGAVEGKRRGTNTESEGLINSVRAGEREDWLGDGDDRHSWRVK